jgi:hypothetical protein
VEGDTIFPSSLKGYCTALEITDDPSSTFGASFSLSSIFGIGSWDFLEVKSSSIFTSLLTAIFLYSGI